MTNQTAVKGPFRVDHVGSLLRPADKKADAAETKPAPGDKK